MIIGILSGFAAAIFQAVSYIYSKVFINKYPKSGAIDLLLLSHFILGLVSVLILPFVWPKISPDFYTYFWQLTACSLFYFGGQAAFFIALETTEASRVAPLLGMKILFLSFFSIAFLSKSYTLLQWEAIVLSIIAGIILNNTGGRLPYKSILWIILACVGYSLSDINIKLIMQTFNYLSTVHASVLCVALNYFVCGILSYLILCFKKPPKGAWKETLKFSATWYISIILLFISFGTISIVLGNIIQSTRGIFSILIAFIISYKGHESIEKKVSSSILTRRILAAFLMTLAITIFILGG